MKNNFKVITEIDNRQVKMVLFSLLVGLITGIAVVAYRLVLHYAEEFAFWVNSYIAGDYRKIIIWFIVLIINGYIIGLMLRRNRLIGGSGIPQVKGVVMGYLKNKWATTFIGKFIGSTITIGSGLSLGREGPSIQLGACIGEGLSKYMTNARIEKKMLMVSGASAGLAAAFNAPFAGVMFALEEIFRYFTPMLLLSTMTAAVAADFVSKQVFGLDSIFSYNITSTIPLNSYWVFIPMGIILGVAGAVYNHVLIATRNLYFKLNFIPVVMRPIIPFIIAGIVGLTFPAILCGGHNITDLL
ncbi:MAG: chloride channel protein, partial [Lentisphaeria bacterium]